MSLRKIYYFLSPTLRFKARRIFYFPIDLFDLLNGRRNKYTPPKGLTFIGSGDFEKQGKHQLELLKTHLNLQEEDDVLDIGSGIGRTAIPLTKFLNSDARYEGFDVVKKGVKWCNEKIKTEFPNFNFTHIQLKNDLYNSTGKDAENFTFPYADKSFDKVFLFSVFTHMQIPEIKNYLVEIHRVLKTDGLCLASFFIYDDKSEEEISNRKHFCFPVKKEGYRLMDVKVKSANIAIHQNKLDQIISETGLKLVTQIKGFWKNGIKKTDNDFQDIAILKKA